jgi:hypothetical protein
VPIYKLAHYLLTFTLFLLLLALVLLYSRIGSE